MSGVGASEDLLDLVYEASVEPNLWPQLLERFASRIGGHAAALRSYDLITEVGGVVASGLDSQMLDTHFRQFANRNPLKSPLDDLRGSLRDPAQAPYRPGHKRDVEWLPKADFARTDYYNVIYKPLDIHSDISIGFSLEGDVWSGMDVYRPKRHGAFTDQDIAYVDAMLPHFARAWNLGRKLARSRETSEAPDLFMESSPHGLFLLDRNLRILRSNRAAEAAAKAGSGFRIAGGRLMLASASAARRLEGLVGAATSPDPGARTGGSMAVTARDRVMPLSLSVAPIRAGTSALFQTEPCALVCVTDLAASISLPEQILRDLFGLTQAETKVAREIFGGATSREAAENLGLSHHTVRHQLLRIYEKTGANKQSALMSLMMRLAQPGIA